MAGKRVVLEGQCRCPGAPHGGGDWVEVIEQIPVELGAGVMAAGSEAGGDGAFAAGLMAKVFLRFGIGDWSFVDEQGAPEDIDWDSIQRLLPYPDSLVVADEIARIHSAGIMRPLGIGSSTSSPSGSTADSTSPNPDGGPSSPTPLEPSSPGKSAGRRSAAPVL